MAMLPREVLESMGFLSLGNDVSISDRASLYGTNRISIGSNVRIDDYCILSAGVGGIEIGDFVHIAAYVSLIGAGKITLSDFCGLSSRVSVYSSNDDYSGAALIGPTVPSKYKAVKHADVTLEKHVIIGSGSIILPGVTLEKGVAVGALSLVNKRCLEFGVYVGNPAKRLKDRKRDLLELERQLIDDSRL
jgi:galactoside O-acetyltransferase